MQEIAFDDVSALRSRISEDFGSWSERVTIDQEMIDSFARISGDQQWIHVDVERSRQESPFGSTIAHGFLVLALAPLIKNTTSYRLTGHSSALNYGIEGLRFVSPVPSGSEIHGRTRLAEVERQKGGVMLTQAVAIHVCEAERPAVVFDWKLLYRA